LLFACGAQPAWAAEQQRLQGMSLDDLLMQRTAMYEVSETASGVNESLRDAPAAMLTIDQQTIQRRGYDSLDDLLIDLPGFDVITTNGTMQVVAYQRGYRTPWFQRTLFLVNGRVDNNLWNHSVQLSRQYPMNIIERVEVLYGPAGAVYGPNAFLGVINVITKAAEQQAHYSASVHYGSNNTAALDIFTSGQLSELSYQLGARVFRSDEPGIDDYAEWGYTDESRLYDVEAWGAGIGDGVDSVTGQSSPAGDVNVNGTIDSGEKFNGKRLGRFADPSDNQGLYAELEWRDWSAGFMHWETDEGYGPYYSFSDAQPNSSWYHESLQTFLHNTSRFGEPFQLDSELLYRESRVGGDWVESFGNFVSLSDWNSFNSAWRLEQQLQWQPNARLNLSAGYKYEQKTLTKAYMICNYWDGTGYCPEQAESSSTGFSSDGSGVVEASVISSENFTRLPPRFDEDSVTSDNQVQTIDRGGFIQGIYELGDWRLNGGIRWDQNSIYGSDLNPRGAVIYHATPRTTWKVIYGEAIQEPSPKDLFGGFNGRAANPDLEPEKAKNLEFVVVHQTRYLLNDMSVFWANYDNVIAGATNVGQRKVKGFEYRGQYRFDNVLTGVSKITGNFYYTYTEAKAEHQYDNVLGEWIKDWDDQGDIAPHKVNLSVNLPLSERWNLNLRGNWSSARELFSQNPLRASSNSARESNRQAESFYQLNGHLLYRFDNLQVGLKIDNITEQEYLLPGVESAGSGDDFSVDNDGFQNSLIPQNAERTFGLTLRVEM
jgi:iron complex outermembrane receptor protein